MTRPQSPLHNATGAVEPGFAELPAFLAAQRPHDTIESDPQSRLEAGPGDSRPYASEYLPQPMATRPGEH